MTKPLTTDRWAEAERTFGLNAADSKAALIIGYILSLEDEVVQLTKQVTGDLADMRREQSSIAEEGKRLSRNMRRLLDQPRVADQPAKKFRSVGTATFQPR